jgi:hypothetical protein
MTSTAPTTTFTYFFMTDHRGINRSTSTLWSAQAPTVTVAVKSLTWK